MPRNLTTLLTALTKAAKKHDDRDATNVMKELTALIKIVKPGDALDAGVAEKLATMFGDSMETLYSLVPREAVGLSVSYFTMLCSHLTSVEPSLRWQLVASKLLAGLQEYVGEGGNATYFEKPFFNNLCQVLTVDSFSYLTIDLRQSIGGFLSEVLLKHESAQKWLVDPKLLGVTRIAKLIARQTDFRPLDAYLQIAARLTPKRSDPQARRTFVRDLFNSPLVKGAFGEEGCKNLVILMEGPQKGNWFHLSDRLFKEIGNNRKRPQRFVLNRLVVCGDKFSSDAHELRLFLDSEITLDIFSDEDGEVMIRTAFDNVDTVVMEETSDSFLRVEFHLQSQPIWLNPIDSRVKSQPLIITFDIASQEAEHLRQVLESKHQSAKLSDANVVKKQSFSRHDMKLERRVPPPLPLKAKANTMKTYFHSTTPSSETELSTAQSLHTKKPENEKSPSKEKEKIIPPATIRDQGVDAPQDDKVPASSTTTLSSQFSGAITKDKLQSSDSAFARRGVIVDSDEENQSTVDTPKSNRKRKASTLSDVEEITSPSLKRQRRSVPPVAIDEEPERQFGPINTGRWKGIDEAIGTYSSPVSPSEDQVPTTDTTARPLGTIIGSKSAVDEVRISAQAHTLGRIKGMKVMNGKPVCCPVLAG